MKTNPAHMLSVHSIRVAAVLMLSASATLFATTKAPSSTQASSSAYIEQPQSSVTTVTSFSSGPHYSSSFYDHSGWSSGYWRSPGFHSYSSYTYYPNRYFFPPTPPALGELYVADRTKSASKVRSTIPLALSEYVNEPFYTPISSFLYDESISKRRRNALEDYMAQKTTLLEELRAKIESLRDATPEAREAQLAEFARVQTPRVAAVEQIAYDIRDDLTHWHLLRSSSNWNEARDWRLGDDTRWESTLDEAKVMRGAAYFQNGLSPAQRRLLREYAMELDDSGRGVATDIGLDTRGPFLYFAPETSRFRLPANMPADLRDRISAYTSEKAALKKELRDVLYREDRRWFDSKRSAALRSLAEAQAPRFAALDTMAEEIRRGLAPLPLPARPRVISGSVPAELSGRISDYLEKRSAYVEKMNGRLATLKRQFPSSRVEFVKMGAGYGIQIVPNRRLKDSDLARINASIAEMVPFNNQQVDAFVQLVAEKEQIREALVAAAGNLGPLVASRIVDLIMKEYSSVLSVEELWRKYRDYEVAVLQPGLSPEQRRMLYDAALVKLGQQLPPYTY